MAEKNSACINNLPIPTRPSSVDDLVNDFNTKLRSTLDSVAPVKFKKVSSKRKPPWRNETVNEQKRNCRKAERRWRNTKLQVHYDILREHLAKYNKAIREARRAHFSELINKNLNNPRILFSTIDSLINPAPLSPCDFFSNTKCNEFSAYFRDKITTIRMNISQTRSDNKLTF